jgi:enterochelin esterase-like enzyme
MIDTYELTYAKCLAAVAPRENARMMGFGHRLSQGTQATIASANERRAADELTAMQYVPPASNPCVKAQLVRNIMDGESWTASRADRAVEALAASGQIMKHKGKGKWWFSAPLPTKSDAVSDHDPEGRAT